MKLPFSFLQTPLYLAVVANQPQMVSMFVQRDANPNSMAQVSCLGCFINARNLVQHSQSEIWFSSPLQKYSSSLTTRILFTVHLIPRLHPSSRILVCICLPSPLQHFPTLIQNSGSFLLTQTKSLLMSGLILAPHSHKHWFMDWLVTPNLHHTWSNFLFDEK